MNDAEAIRSYFGQPGFARFLKLLERQYTASREGVRGYVTLSHIREDERRALDGFFGTYSPHMPGESKRYSLRKFERLLMDSRFALTVPDLLEVLRGEPVLTRKEQDQREQEAWRELIQTAWEKACRPGSLDEWAFAQQEARNAGTELRKNAQGPAFGAASPSSEPIPRLAERSGSCPPAIKRWVQALLEETAPGTRTLKLWFAKAPEEVRLGLPHCFAALNMIAGRAVGAAPIRLPVLAAKVTGDAHALDWKRPLGRLFWWGLAAIQGQQQTASFSEEGMDAADLMDQGSTQAIIIREGYRRSGVADDDLSSQVMLYAPALFGACEERVLTLRQVERLAAASRLEQLHYPCVYMVENPSVFAELIDAGAALDRSPIIVCGNGQPTTAVIRLLDLMLVAPRREGVILLRYAGDLDPAGIGIADALKHRYAQSFQAWRMNRDTYLQFAHRGVPLSPTEQSRLRERQLHGFDAELINAMMDKGMKLYQELWVDELVQDLVR